VIQRQPETTQRTPERTARADPDARIAASPSGGRRLFKLVANVIRYVSRHDIPAAGPRSRMTKEAARVRERFERVLSAGVAISGEHSLGAVLQRVVDSARTVVGSRYAALGVLNDDGDALIEFVTSGVSEQMRRRVGALPTGHGLLGAVIRDARPLRTADINAHPLRHGFPPNHPAMQSFLGVPIIGRERVFGNLYLTNKLGADDFGIEDEQIAVLLAAHAAVAIENARLYEESQRLVAQVQSMQRQRDLFFAMMNHELRNALTGVYGWAEMLVRGKPVDEVPQAAREVYEAAERTIELLNNFLDLTRLDAGKVRPVVREVEALASIDRAFSSVMVAARAKGIALRRSGSALDATLHTDPVRLEQILLNLLSNGIRHSTTDVPLVVDVQVIGMMVEFRVIDRGSGVASDLVERIFEPFERFDPHSGLGTGLGLPVSRRLAEVLGGHLRVERSDASGSVFLLALPQHPAR
jgi:signal transduction histidine kinase